jgi:hypothetical protein
MSYGGEDAAFAAAIAASLEPQDDPLARALAASMASMPPASAAQTYVDGIIASEEEAAQLRAALEAAPYLHARLQLLGNSLPRP